jgi:thioesterase domain-containing protein
MCEGAIIAFFVARQLEAEGEMAPFVMILDAWARENSRNRYRIRRNYYVRRLRSITKRSPAEAWGIVSTAVRNRVRWLIHGKSELQRIHEQVYWPGKDFVPPQIDAHILLIRVPQQYEGYVDDLHLGWTTRTRSGVDVNIVEGIHQSMLKEPTVRDVARILAEAIDRADVRAGLETAGSATVASR